MNYSIYPCFMPRENCMALIIDWIQNAKKSILLQAYRFSSRRICNALKNARIRNIFVKVLIDKDAEKARGNLVNELIRVGINVEIDEEERLAHNKIMIIDDELVITGSYNWTDRKDSDVILFITNKCVTEAFKENFYDRRNQHTNSFKQFNFLIPENRCCSLQFMNNVTLDQVAASSTDNMDVTMCFTPNENCINLIKREIESAKNSIFIQACCITHRKIADALIGAHDRNVVVKVLIDRKALLDRYQQITNMANGGISILREDVEGGIAHSKIIIIDSDIVIVGSLNLSYSAQRNSENIVIVRNCDLCDMFKGQWNKLTEYKEDLTCEMLREMIQQEREMDSNSSNCTMS